MFDSPKENTLEVKGTDNSFGSISPIVKIAVAVALLLDVLCIVLVPKMIAVGPARYGNWHLPLVIEYSVFVVATPVFAVAILLRQRWGGIGLVSLMLLGFVSDGARTIIYHPNAVSFIALGIACTLYIGIFIVIINGIRKIKSKR